jgi:hypothetical protein
MGVLMPEFACLHYPLSILFCFREDNSMQWLTVLTNIVLVLITAMYVVLTYLILRSNKKAVAVMKEQSESFYRPHITITHSLAQTTLIRLSIINTGKTSAQELHLDADKGFEQLQQPDMNLRDNQAFAGTVKSFPPGCELSFALISNLAVKKGMENDPKTPTVFDITASYSFAGKRFSETTSIDLRIYDVSFMPRKSVADEVSETTKALTKISEILTAIKGNRD